MRRLGWVIGLGAMVLAGCGEPEPAARPAAPPAPSAAAASPASPAPEPALPDRIYSEMVVVDFEDKPLAGMIPIATLNPNAFDRPIASGAPTDAEGKSVIMLPQNTRLFLRAWDERLAMFPNNFLEVPAMRGTRTQQGRVTMVPAAAAEATIQDAAGNPLPGVEARVMLIHPKHGPWWPARAMTDGQGRVSFAPVPPGEYLIQIDVAGSGQANLPVTFLPPTRTTDLGAVTLAQ